MHLLKPSRGSHPLGVKPKVLTNPKHTAYLVPHVRPPSCLSDLSPSTQHCLPTLGAGRPWTPVTCLLPDQFMAGSLLSLRHLPKSHCANPPEHMTKQRHLPARAGTLSVSCPVFIFHKVLLIIHARIYSICSQAPGGYLFVQFIYCYIPTTKTVLSILQVLS